jgi:hypothetical protein
LSGKHTTAFPLRRYSFIAGAATLLVVLVSWVAVRAVGPVEPAGRVPLMVQPTIPLAGAAPPAVPPSASPSRSPSASPSPSPSSKPVTKPAPRRTTRPPAPAASFTASFSVGASWDRGFIGAVAVTNATGPARNWTVKVTFESSAGVRLGNTWNAKVTRDGDTFVFTGGPLAPGASVTFGFEAAKQVRSKIQPAACTVDGAPCRVG